MSEFARQPKIITYLSLRNTTQNKNFELTDLFAAVNSMIQCTFFYHLEVVVWVLGLEELFGWWANSDTPW